MTALSLYFGIGALWTLGVCIARVFDGFVYYPRAWVWIPLTLLVWPVSVYISLVELVEGFREGQIK